MRSLVFLFIFVFSPLAFNVSGDVGSPEIDKPKELVEVLPIFKTVEEELLEAFSDWKVASATYYDPFDTAQTKKNPDGMGTFERMVGSGSVALGSSFTKIIREEKMEVFMEVLNLKVVTPYGIGIFRVDDAMPGDYDDKEKIHIDFFHEDLSPKWKRIGRFEIKFKIVKIQIADS